MLPSVQGKVSVELVHGLSVRVEIARPRVGSEVVGAIKNWKVAECMKIEVT